MDPEPIAALTDLLADAIEDAVLVLDARGEPAFASRALREILSASDGGTLDSLFERIHPDDREDALELVSSQSNGRPAKRLRVRVQSPDQPPRQVELQVERSAAGVIARFRNVVLPEPGSTNALEQIAAHLRDVLWLVDVPRGKLLYVSPGFESLFRRSRKVLQTGPRAFYDAVHEDDRERLQKAAREGVETGFTEEFRVMLPEGDVRWVRHRSIPLRSAGSGRTLTVGITTDIDERHRAEEARNESDRRFALLCGDSFETMSELDAEGRVVWTSERTGIRFGKPDPESRRPRTDLVHPEDLARTLELFGAAFRERRRVTVEYRAADEEGVWRWLETTVHPFRAESGDGRALFVSRDISKRRELVEQLRDSEERFRLLAENAHDLITEHAESGRVRWANRKAVEASGYSFEQMVNTSPLENMHPEDRERIAARIWRLSPDGEGMSITFRNRHGDGSWHWYEANLHTYTTASGDTRLVSVARDVSDRKHAEGRLRESEERHRQLVEQSPEGILVHADGRILYANPAAVRLTGGATRSDLLGRTVSDLLDPVAPEPESPPLRDDARRDEAPRELSIRRLDGETREVMGSHSGIGFDGRAAVQTVLRDVTESRRAERERERLWVQLQEARRLESLGVLAGGIAHDFNNLLAVMLGNLNFARRLSEGDSEVRAALADAAEAGESAARLTRQLLAYAGRRTPEVRPVDLSQHVRSIQGPLEAVIPKKVELRFELAPSLPSVRADVVQLEQVVMNLVRNAAEAVGDDDGHVTVSTGATRIGSDAPRDWAGGDELTPGDYAYLEVCDDGVGMDAETRRRIFDPFFTTKRAGHGLGLSAVLGLVRGHGGGIELRSEPGEGTSIRVHLPACVPGASRPREADGVFPADPRDAR